MTPSDRTIQWVGQKAFQAALVLTAVGWATIAWLKLRDEIRAVAGRRVTWAINVHRKADHVDDVEDDRE